MQVTTGQRALWTFLFHTLIGPFFAAFIILLLTLGAGAIGRGPQSLQGLDLHGLFSVAGAWAVTSYVWSALPAGVTGAVMALLTYLRGSYHWLAAATAAAVAATVFAVQSGGTAAQHAWAIAFIAAIVAIACRAVLVTGKIIVEPSA